MSTHWTAIAIAFSLATALMSGCGKDDSQTVSTTGPSAGAGGKPTYTIAVIPKGTTHIFWKSVEAGARKAAAEMNVEMIWKGPVKEDDRAQQMGVIDQFVAQGVNGIVLAPLDRQAMVRPVAAAKEKNVPVVIIDSALQGEGGKDFISLVATDNRKGGEMDGQKLGELLGGKGKVVMLRYMEGSASTIEREEGFMEAIKKFPEIQIIVSNRFGGATSGEAQSAAMNLADRFREADGVFCSNESATFGTLQALRQLQLAGKVKFVGFDASAPLIDAMKKGEIHALVAQDPIRMGYLGMKAMVDHLNGQKVEPLIDTGAKLVTPENVDSPDIKALLGT